MSPLGHAPHPVRPDLMRSLGLDVDGPVRWGQQPTTRGAGIFVVETAAPSTSPAIDADRLRRWIERVPSLRLDGETPTPSTLGRRLATFWVPEASLLYVGRSTSQPGGPGRRPLRDRAGLSTTPCRRPLAQDAARPVAAPSLVGRDGRARGVRGRAPRRLRGGPSRRRPRGAAQPRPPVGRPRVPRRCPSGDRADR